MTSNASVVISNYNNLYIDTALNVVFNQSTPTKEKTTINRFFEI